MKIVLVVSPNMALLDAWLPVCFEIQNRSPQTEFLLVLPKSRLLADISDQWIITQIADGLFDRVIFASRIGDWLSSKSLMTARKRVQKEAKVPGLGLLAKLLPNRVLRSVRGLLQDGFNDGIQNVEIRSNILDGARILMDVEAENSFLRQGLFGADKAHSLYSMPHGLAPPSGDEANSNLRPTELSVLGPKLRFCFSHSEQHSKRLSSSAHLRSTEIRVVPVPRLDWGWVSMIRGSEGRTADERGPYIFIVSRPDTTSYLPPARRARYLRDIADFAANNDLRVLVKLHPKERDNGSFAAAFGPRLQGAWEITNRHPLSLDEGCAFAVTFLSGVSIDLAAVGVPCIEYLDLSGLEEWDHPESRRDSRGYPILGYREKGIALGASDSQEFWGHARRCMEHREEVATELFRNASGIFNLQSAGVSAVANLLDT